MNTRHTLLIVFCILLPTLLLGQLKEFEVKDLPQPESIPVFIDFPQQAAIIIQSSITDLQISSTLGVVADRSRPREGKYTIILAPRNQVLTIKAPGFQESKLRITGLKAKDVRYYSVELLQVEGTLMLSTRPEGAEVIINGTPYGTTPLTQELVEGEYVVEIKQDWYHDRVETIEVVRRDTANYTWLLDPAFGKLKINSTPPGAEVFLDGNLIGTTPITENQVRSGDHRLVLRLEPYAMVDTTVTVEDGKTSSDNIIMPKTEEALLFESAETWKKRRKLTMIGSLAMGGSGLVFTALANNKFDDYSKAVTSKEAIDLRTSVENLDTYSAIAYTGAVLFTGWTVFNHLKIPDLPEEPTAGLSLEWTGNGLAAVYRFK